ncbi:3TM-type holin [Vreelandella sp. EE27]
MQWRDVAETVGGMAPLLGSALGGQAGGAVGTLAARALGVKATPEAVKQALGDPDATLKLQRLENEHEQTLTRMILEAESARLTEVNQTMRAEAASCDPFVRRWRPTFGYLTALAWVIQGVAIAWSIVASPEHAGIVAQAITALTPMWGIALAMLGVNATCRSKDKQVAAGQRPTGFMDAVATRISR